MPSLFEAGRDVAGLSGGETVARRIFSGGSCLYETGHVLTAADVARLRGTGLTLVWVLVDGEAKAAPGSAPRSFAYEGVAENVAYDRDEGTLRVDSPRMAAVHRDVADSARRMLQAVLSGSFAPETAVAGARSILAGVRGNREAMLSLVFLQDVDRYTFLHSVNVSVLVALLGSELGLPGEELERLATGAILHDVGKMAVDQAVLNKPGRLTPEEFEEMKNHPKRGYDILRANGVDERVAGIALLHHEKLDGKGYPLGLAGERVPGTARIASIADVYDALTAERVYKKGMHPAEALGILFEGANTAFDEALLEAFRSAVGVYPVSSRVLLANGAVGRVVAASDREGEPGSPVVEVLVDRYGKEPRERLVVSTRGAEWAIKGPLKG